MLASACGLLDGESRRKATLGGPSELSTLLASRCPQRAALAAIKASRWTRKLMLLLVLRSLEKSFQFWKNQQVLRSACGLLGLNEGSQIQRSQTPVECVNLY